jgi:hypothetical protein
LQLNIQLAKKIRTGRSNFFVTFAKADASIVTLLPGFILSQVQPLAGLEKQARTDVLPKRKTAHEKFEAKVASHGAATVRIMPVARRINSCRKWLQEIAGNEVQSHAHRCGYC